MSERTMPKQEFLRESVHNLTLHSCPSDIIVSFAILMGKPIEVLPARPERALHAEVLAG